MYSADISAALHQREQLLNISMYGMPRVTCSIVVQKTPALCMPEHKSPAMRLLS